MESLKKLGRFIVVVGIPVIFFWGMSEVVKPPYNEWQVPAIVAISTMWASGFTYAFTKKGEKD